MKNTIQDFYLQKAIYLIREVDGQQAYLHLDYADNSYSILGRTTERIQGIACDLLSRKHGVNFADKFNDKME